jgi:hypothetical protein
MNNRGIASLIRRYQEGGEVEDDSAVDAPAYVASVSREDRRMDPWMAQLLYGMPDASGTLQGGFIPGAFAAAESAFFDDEGKPLVVGQEYADFTPDQVAAFDLTRKNVGIQQPFLEQAQDAYASGIGALDYGLDQQLLQGQRGMSTLKGAAGYEEAQRMLGLQDALGGIDEARGLYRDTLGEFDQSMTQDYYDPYEQQVVDQTVDDAMRGLARTDQQAIAQAIGSGGESAFGSRAGLAAADRAEAVGRGLGKEIGNIRSRGYQQAQSAAMGEFGRQQAAKRQAAGALSNLGQAGMGARTGAGQAGMGTASTLAAGYGNLGNLYGSAGAQRLGAQQGYGGFMQGLGGQMQAANQADIAALSGIGALQQGYQQNILDAQRQMLQQAQMAPLMQYQALMPFVSMAGQQTGPSGIRTDFTPGANPLQAALGVGLSTAGALGNYMNPYAGYGQQQQQQQQQQ